MHLASLVTQTVKSLPAMQETGFHPWVGKIPWRREWQPTPVLLTGKIPWMEEPGGLQSMRSQSRTRLSNFTFIYACGGAKGPLL